MNDERDPLLETLIGTAERELVEDHFTDAVMTRIAGRRRNVLIGRIAIIVLLVAFEILLSAPLQNSVGEITQVLSTSLVELDDGWLATVVAPLNSTAGLIGIILVGLQFLYRRLVR